MAKKEENKKRQKMLLAILGVVVLVAAFVFFLPSGGSSIPVEQITGETKVEKISDINFSVLDSEIFKQFDVWSVIPITVGEVGKDNPFSK